LLLHPTKQRTYSSLKHEVLVQVVLSKWKAYVKPKVSPRDEPKKVV
jgi:hypothetical protein